MSIYYFAYGSNLDFTQMQSRCPDVEIVGRSLLKDHKLSFCGFSKNWGGGVATVIDFPRFFVPGILYKISEESLLRLDQYEGSNYVRELEEVYLENFGQIQSKNMCRDRKLPSASYWGAIISAYRSYNFNLTPLHHFLGES